MHRRQWERSEASLADRLARRGASPGTAARTKTASPWHHRYGADKTIIHQTCSDWRAAQKETGRLGAFPFLLDAVVRRHPLRQL